MTTPLAPISDNTTPPGTSTGGPAPVTVINQPPPPGQYYTAEQLEAARQQEKDKLYNRLEEQTKQLNIFRTQVEELNADKATRDAEAKKLADAAAASKKAEEESKLTAEQLIAAREAEFTKQQTEFQQQMENRIAIMQKEQEFLQLQSYIQRRVAELIAADEVIPDLVEFIGGNSIDEVEASINKVKEKTANIVKGAATLSAPGMPTGVSPTGGPSGLLDNLSGPREFSKEEIAAMPMDQYKAWREQRGLDRAGNNRGMFN